VGDKQRFLVCLITLKVLVDQATGWPSQYLTNDVISFLKNELQVVGVRTSVEASRHPKVINYVNNCIDLTNKQSVSRAAHLKKFMIVPTDFSVPGGELTPTLKVKRRVTEQKYKT
jgi:long-chain-fatty-acid--CoA ligase ACSBG